MQTDDAPNTDPDDLAMPPPSGSRPAGGAPRPAPSGTSGTFLTYTSSAVGGHERNGNSGEGLCPAGLPSVPDTCPTPMVAVPDMCPTPTDVVPDDGHDAPGPQGGNNGHDNRSMPQIPLLFVDGVLRVGGMRQPREAFSQHDRPELHRLLGTTNLPPDTVIEAVGTAHFTVLDLDVHHWSQLPTTEELEAHLAGIQPPPDAAWTSHGRGLKLVYTGPCHCDRALAAAFAAPSSFNVELLNHTRHPGSTSTAHPGARCGDMVFLGSDPAEPFVFRSVGRLTPELRSRAVEALGLGDGDRHDHDHCPIDPGADSDARGCVVVLDAGVYCHRCAGHGRRYRDHLQPGFFPFTAVVGTEMTELDELAECRVHWTQARLVLQHRHPNLVVDTLRRAYRRSLETRYGDNDLRIPLVFNADLDFVRGDGGWLDTATLQPTHLDDDAANGLPYVQYIKTDRKLGCDPVRRSQVKARTPRGYRPIRPVRGFSFFSGGDAIPYLVPPTPKYPIELLSDPIPEEEAYHQLEQFFPRLDRRYFRACSAAAICGEAHRGQVPMLACTGTSGSGKEQTIRLAASFVGQDIVKLSLDDKEEDFFRQLGSLASSGYRFLVFDELARTAKLTSKLKMLLEISQTVHWRPLYGKSMWHTPLRAAVFFPSIRFPDFLTSSQEFNRRVRRAHLHRQVPNWAETSGGDTIQWRDRSEDNALLANSILTHIWRLCTQYDFRFL